MCDGASPDEVLLATHAGVVRCGWAIQGVVGHDPHEVDWLYSVGLSEGFGHPELVVVGVKIPEPAQAVNELGGRSVPDGALCPVARSTLAARGRARPRASGVRRERADGDVAPVLRSAGRGGHHSRRLAGGVTEPVLLP